MKTASILLALVVVLGFAREAWAIGDSLVADPDYTIQIGECEIGIADICADSDYLFTEVYLGQLSFQVPFTATQGLVGFCFILATLIIVPVVFTARWKKKRVQS